ncbi:MAG: glycosyltransferase [Candidatus Nanoarchaeia archaeon]|nr:glycosyltransferase [Candidatus Nanoarchaeia archaeon]
MLSFTALILWITYFIGLFILVFWFIVFFERGIENKNLKIRDYPSVSIAIPAYNEEITIKDTIDSLLNLDYPKELIEIIVVNDGSKDNTKAIVEKTIEENKQFNIVLINQKNSGKGAALNNALRHAKGKFFVVLDADSMVRSDALKKILPVFREDKKIAVVLPLMRVKNTKTFLQKLQWCEYITNNFSKKLITYLDCCHVAPGPFSVYRRDVIASVHGFSENNLTEDLEMALRLQEKNYRLVQVMNTVVYTKVPVNLKAFLKQRNRWYKGALLNVIKYRRMLFNLDYGDFGIFHLPTVLFAAIISLTVLLVSVYNYLIIPGLQELKNIGAINYDLPIVMGTWFKGISVMDFNVMNIFLAAAMFFILLCLIYFSYKSHQEKLSAFGYLPLIGYFFIYAFLILISWAWVFFDIATGRKIQRW